MHCHVHNNDAIIVHLRQKMSRKKTVRSQTEKCQTGHPASFAPHAAWHSASIHQPNQASDPIHLIALKMIRQAQLTDPAKKALRVAQRVHRAPPGHGDCPSIWFWSSPCVRDVTARERADRALKPKRLRKIRGTNEIKLCCIVSKDREGQQKSAKEKPINSPPPPNARSKTLQAVDFTGTKQWPQCQGKSFANGVLHHTVS